MPQDGKEFIREEIDRLRRERERRRASIISLSIEIVLVILFFLLILAGIRGFESISPLLEFSESFLFGSISLLVGIVSSWVAARSLKVMAQSKLVDALWKQRSTVFVYAASTKMAFKGLLLSFVTILAIAMAGIASLNWNDGQHADSAWVFFGFSVLLAAHRLIFVIRAVFGWYGCNAKEFAEFWQYLASQRNSNDDPHDGAAFEQYRHINLNEILLDMETIETAKS